MKCKKKLLLTLVLLFGWNCFAQQSDWLNKIKTISVMSSTRNDIAKNFGEPDESVINYMVLYRLQEGDLYIDYSKGLCNEKNKTGWNVTEGTVIKASFYPYKHVYPKMIKVNFKGFKKYLIKDVPKAFIYENDDIGNSFSTDIKGKIESISFYPSERLDYLRCSEILR